MPRLIDDIRTAGKFVMPWCVAEPKIPAWEQHSRRLWDILIQPDLPVLKIDNVAEFYYTASGQEYWDLRDHFPNLAPPYPLAWYESKMPRVIHSDELGDTKVGELVPSGRVGILMFGVERAGVQGEDIPPDMHWALVSEIFIDYGSTLGGIHGPHGTINMAVDKEGRLIDRPWMQTYCWQRDQEMIKNLINWTHPALLSICFMHCKNVSIVDELVPKPLAKKYHNKTGRWPARYKTLVIEPLKQILRHEGKSESVGIIRAMHICRGHFKDYRQGKGLFGKYHQLVWQPSIVRGGTGKEEKAPPREIEVKL
ncbi:MAG: hypothetical protein C5B60_09150 [Chloroflexi bacterium]|nr:MAG: hypothetical protein C5B60_09150 [Chloroflexota bacterium]